MIGLLIQGVLMVITFFTIYMGIKEIRDEELNGVMTTGLAIRKGMKIALIAGILAGVFSVIYTKLIDPGFIDRMMEATETKFDEMNAPESQREISRSIMKFMFNPFLTVPFTILWVCFWGLLKSLVAGSMLKKEAPPSVPPSIPTV
jgi:Na+/H+-dicarboxylate symporter